MSAGQSRPLLIGEAATRTYRLIGRRQSGEERAAPAEVIVPEPLRVESITPAEEAEGPDGIIESSRQVTVALPTRAKLGPSQAAISLRWPDGMVQVHHIAWSVEPRIRSFPPVLVLKAGAGSTVTTVEVRSEDRPFRVIRVAGELLAGDGPTSPEPARAHTLRLALDPAKFAPDVKPEVEITTDDPDQPLLKLGVLVAPHREAAP